MTENDALINDEAEESLAGSLILNPQEIPNVMSICSISDFHSIKAGIIVDAIYKIYPDLGVDIRSVSSYIQKAGMLDEIGGFAYLIKIVTDCPTSVHATSYAKIVHEASSRRKIYANLMRSVNRIISGKPMEEIVEEILNYSSSLDGKYANHELDVISAFELSKLDISEDLWLVEKRVLLNGINMVSGLPGTGKSFLGLDLCVGHALGDHAWGEFDLPKGQVMYYYLDGTTGGLKDRVVQMCKARGVVPPTDLHFFTHPLDLSKSLDLAIIRRHIKKYQITLVVFDVLARYIPRIDENSVKEISPIFTSLREIANELQVTFVLIHHFNKGAHSEKSCQVRGSIDIVGNMDSALGVTQKDQKYRQLYPIKIKEGKEPPTIEFQIIENDGGVKLEFTGVDDIDRENNFSLRELTFRKITYFLKENSDLCFSKSELINQLQIESLSVRSLDRVFTQLNKYQHVVVSKNGSFNLYQWSELSPATPLL